MKWNNIKNFLNEIYGSQNIDCKLWQKWVETYQITHWTTDFNLKKFNVLKQPPHYDHAVLFKTISNQIILIYNSYDDLQIIEKDVIDWNKNYDFNIEVYPNSWYKGTTLIVILFD